MIEKVVFVKFRCAENLELKIGRNLTLIAGQNGTMKSTFLACLAQPFGIGRGRKNDLFSQEKLEKCKIVNDTFNTRISDIFKLSENFDVPGEHEFDVYFSEDSPKTFVYENPLKVKSYARKDTSENKLRFVTGKDRTSGKGNLPIPVIYLGLSRLYPLGESVLEKKFIELTDDEKKFLCDNYTKILLNYDEEYKEINQISKNNKNKTTGISTDKYDWQSISAGQDNVGKIISTILEFKRLKTTFKDNYYGGILLIDEVESTLYPRAQEKLIDFLNKQASHLNLQVICTTHSLEIIKECLEKEVYRKHTVINFLDKTQGSLLCKNILTFDDIFRNLLVRRNEKHMKEEPKINIFTEDLEGAWLLKKIINIKFNDYIDIVPLELGCSEIAKINTKLLKNGIITYDADVQKTYDNSKETSNFKKDMKKMENYLFLPGNKSIEEDFIDILNNIRNDETSFWEKCKNNTHQLAMDSLEKYDLTQRNERKNWFNTEKKQYGKDGIYLLNRWKKQYEEQIKQFNCKLEEKLKQCYKDMYGIILFKEK